MSTPANGALRTALDRIARLASELTGAAAGQVAMLAEEQTIIAGSGLAAAEVGRTRSPADTVCAVAVASGEPLVVPDAAADARVAGRAPVLAGEVGSYLGVPLSTRSGEVGTLCVYDPAARQWSPAEVSLLQQLATSVTAELELAVVSGEYDADRARWELAAEAAGVGTFELDAATGALVWDARTAALVDSPGSDGSVAAWAARMHPEDGERVRRDVDAALRDGGDLDAEYRVHLPGGGQRRVAVRGRARCGADGAAVSLVGAVFDVTARTESEARLARVLESTSLAFCSLDRDWRTTYVNAHAEQLLGTSRHDLLGSEHGELLPGAAHPAVAAHYRRAMDAQRVVTFEVHRPAPLDAWYEVTAEGGPDGLAVYFTDVTARRVAQAAAERSNRRLLALGEVALALTDAEDITDLVTIVAERGLAALGCDGGAVAVPDPRPVPGEPEHLLSYLTTSYGPGSQAAYGRLPVTARLPVCEAAGGRLVLLEDEAASLAYSPEMAGVVATTGSQAWASVPLRAAGRVVGVLTAGWDDPQVFDAEQVDLLETFAAQCAQALDRLHARQAERSANLTAASFSETLQRSLLSSPVEPEHLLVEVRYQPATADAQVGGDWYDAFRRADGTTSLVVGDVTGHDQHAAAAMGQLRNLLRGIGYASSQSPAAVLGVLDRAVQDLRVGALATLVLAQVAGPAPGTSASVGTSVGTSVGPDGGAVLLRWSNAGHPWPLLVEPDGTARYLDTDSDLLVGVDPDADRHDHEVVLQPGATVLLFTDGLVERRGTSLGTGLSWLRQAAADVARRGCTLPELCDELLRLVEGGTEDDVVLLALRVHPDAGPAPAPRR